MSIKGDLDTLSLQGANIIEPVITLGIAGIIAVLGWRFIQNMAIWASLKIKGYREREEVYLNGTSVVITKLGFLTTTFLVLNGEDTTNTPVMRWACISNIKLDNQKIERISLKPTKLSFVKPPKKTK